ncbi:hypothetical protein F4780DRAFT_473108 [Xylariomycetidae sp. FL0641]|nr:hypothetical protein F4780DRAFT_473108 [Xylariomycetidae sp. FL0641]
MHSEWCGDIALCSRLNLSRSSPSTPLYAGPSQVALAPHPSPSLMASYEMVVNPYVDMAAASTSPPSDAEAREVLGLEWTPEQRDAYVNGVKVVYLPRLDTPYPTANLYIAGTPRAKEDWTAYWGDKPLKDPRGNKGRRRGIETLDASKLKYTVRQDESVIFRDAETEKMVLVVLRDFLPDEELRQTMVGSCKELVKYRRDDRREDPGQLVHFGYTAGSRNSPQVQLTSSSVRLDTAARQKAENRLNANAQGMAGVFWSIMKSKVPPEITADYNDMIEECDFPRMDMGRSDRTFTYRVKGEDVTFDGLELPPPSGMSSINYARHTHNEINANDWVAVLTTHAPDDPSKGGNFYLASYGIMTEPASNTFFAWHPTDYHGTTLYEMLPGNNGKAGYETRKDKGFNTGVVLEISKALRSARNNSTWLDRKTTSVGKPRRPRRPVPTTRHTRYNLRPRIPGKRVGK